MRFSIFRWILAGTLALSLCLAVACNNGGDDDDDDGEPSFGEDIRGTYMVSMTYDVDTCSSDDVDQDPVDWVIEIEQNDDLNIGWVRYKLVGTGNDSVELFQGTVYGNVIIKAGIESSTVGADCKKISVENYTTRVDVDAGTLTGHLSKDIFHRGQGCEATIDCYFEQSFGPAAD